MLSWLGNPQLWTLVNYAKSNFKFRRLCSFSFSLLIAEATVLVIEIRSGGRLSANTTELHINGT